MAIHSTRVFDRFLSHLGFGLITYLPLIFFASDLIIRGHTGIKEAIEVAFSFSVYIIILGTLGWKFAILALIIASVVLSKGKFLKLNIATIIISIIILLWNFLTLATGG
jgi:hypothetical protein